VRWLDTALASRGLSVIALATAGAGEPGRGLESGGQPV